MKRLNRSFTIVPGLLVVGLHLAVMPTLQAQESDLSSSVTLPAGIMTGESFWVTVGYANHGPDTADTAYPSGEFVPPMGLDVFLDNFWNGNGSMFANLQGSASDSLGNNPILFWDDYYCETVFFQVQGHQPGPTPIAPLGPGEGGSFSFETAFPMESPRGGNVEITSPTSLAKVWTLTDKSDFFIEKGYGTVFSTYATTSCELLVGNPGQDVCAHISDNCWGAKVSHLADPIEAEFVLVDDGTAVPTFGCEVIINDVAGKIAVLERGGCEFGVKGYNAEQAGALAVFMVNNGLCGAFPASPDCVVNLAPGYLGAQVNIPVVLISQGDGVDLLATLQNSETVSGIIGGSSIFAVQGWTYHDEVGLETDPNDDNNVVIVKAAVSIPNIFEDGFESGLTDAWSNTVTP
jgi:hypothetical protein